MQYNGNLDELLEQLGSESVLQKNKAHETLRNIGTPAVPRLIQTVESGTDRQVLEAVKLLGELKASEAVYTVCGALEHPNRLVRENAANTLGQLGDIRAGDALLARLNEDHRLVQVLIIDALGKIGEKRAIPHLMDILKTTDHPQIMYMSIRALTALHAREALDLIKSFEDYDEHHVRHDVQEAIKRLS